MGNLIIDVPETKLSAEDREILRHPSITGVILFARNYESPAQLQSLIQEIRAIRNPFIIAVDHEGGRVQRFLEGFTRLPSMRHWGNLFDHNPDEALNGLTQAAEVMAHELLSMGINVNLAPVLDVDQGKSAIIGERSFHHDTTVIVKLAAHLIAAMHHAGMPAIGKHFPGHGAVIADSHVALPIDERDWETIEKVDLVPFSKLMPTLDGVMPAHIVYTKLDKAPACFSSFWLKEVLRQQMQFQGVVISDDLTMKGAASIGSYAQRARSALQAGCDLLLICNNRLGAIEVLNADGVSSDAASKQRVANFILKLQK